MEELASVNPTVAGLCLDTCHLFAAGYCLDSKDFSYPELQQHVKLIHLNDSRYPCGSGLDRHEHLGKGSIGVNRLREFIKNVSVREAPIILETPRNNIEDDRMNLRVLLGMLK